MALVLGGQVVNREEAITAGGGCGTMNAAVRVTVLMVLLAGSAFGLTIPAEGARIHAVGGAGNGAWNLWSNGEWGDFVHIAKAGTYTVRVTAYGSSCQGVWPAMGFTVDGVTKEQVKVESAKAQEYTFKLAAEAKDYRLSVAFLNDAMVNGEDRNLFIVSMQIEGPAGAPAPTLATQETSEAWQKAEMKLEEEELARAAKEIEKNRKNDAVIEVVDGAGRAVRGAKVSVELARHEFLFGANIMMFDRFPTAAENELYKERFRELFNYATTAFYWISYERERGKPDYASTDKIVEWCIANHIRLKGHPLLWSNPLGIPPWSQGQPAREVQKARVQEIMKRYAGRIADWEVVNEAFATVEIDQPYRWAREADPTARLIVNNFGMMWDGGAQFLGMLAEAKEKGVPFDGIGIQAHEPQWAWFPLQQVRKVLEDYAKLGKEIYITEFTPESGGGQIRGSYKTGKWDEATQAEYAVKFYRVCFANPSVRAITWWDLADPGAFRATGGMLHKDLSPKPTYTALMKLIHEEWWTKEQGTSDGQGRFGFRGFRGEYVAKITRGAKTVEKAFTVGKEDGVIRITVGN